MKHKISLRSVLQLLTSILLAFFFAWSMAWRISGFGSFLRSQKITWLAIFVVLFFVLFYYFRQVIWEKLKYIGAPRYSKKRISRFLILFAFLPIFLVLFLASGDYLSNKYNHSLEIIAGSDGSSMRLFSLRLTDREEPLKLSDFATQESLIGPDSSIVLENGQSYRVDTFFFYNQYARPQLEFLYTGGPATLLVDGESFVLEENGSDQPVVHLYNLGEVEATFFWRVLYWSKILSLLGSCLILIILIMPNALLEQDTVKKIPFHTITTLLIILALGLAFLAESLPSRVSPAWSGLDDLFNFSWVPLSFDTYLTYLFVLVVLILFYLVKPRWRWLVLLVASYLFLVSFDLFYGIVLLLITLISYFSAYRMAANQDERAKRNAFRWGALGVVGILLFFKYAGTVLAGLVYVFQPGEYNTLVNILLPLGISFYSLTALAYLMDVRSGATAMIPHFGKFALFMAYFPKILMGPVERAQHFFTQLEKETVFQPQQFTNALTRIGLGLFRKLLVSNRLAIIANAIFISPSDHSSGELWVGLLAFSFQVYVDFSAYTDIAIGISQLFGIELFENFKRPYFATSVTEFWRRWHISFSTWLRDYIFLPLQFETRRVRSSSMRYINIFSTFLISGIWHGVGLNFLVWGALHGSYQIMEDVSSRARESWLQKTGHNNIVSKFLQVGITFFLVSFAWIFFRAENLLSAFDYIAGLFSLSGLFMINLEVFALAAPDFWLAMLLLPMIVLLDLIERRHHLIEELTAQPLFLRWAIYLTGIFIMIIFGYYGSFQIDYVYLQF